MRRGSGAQFGGGALTIARLMALLDKKGLTDAQARAAVGGAETIDDGLAAIGVMTVQPDPAPTYGLIAATKDGSTGQTYSLVGEAASWTNIRWYRRALAAPYTMTPIAGAVATTYVAQAADEGCRLVARGRWRGLKRATMAVHVIFAPPILLEGFETASDWTASNGAVLASVTSGAVQGTNMLQVKGTGTSNPKVDKANIGTFDPATLGVICLYADLGQDTIYQQINTLRRTLTRGGTEYSTGTGSSFGYSESTYQTPAPLLFGGLWDAFAASEMGTSSVAGAFAGIGSGQLGASITLSTVVPYAATTKLDAMMARAGGRPTIMLDFDDVFASQYLSAWPILKARGVPVTINVIANRMDQINRLTTDWLREMVAGGCDVSLNSTDDGPLTGKGSIDAAIADLLVDRKWLTDRGFTGALDHFVYPNGTYQRTGTKVLINAVTSNGTDTVTLGNSVSTITVGMAVAGFNVPAGTTVLAVNSANSLKLSNAVPAQTKPMSFTDVSDPFSPNRLQTALKAAGFKSARTTLNRGGTFTRFGPAGRALTMPGNPTSARTQQQLIDMVNQIRLRGTTGIFYTHSVLVGASGVDTELSFYSWWINYLADLRDAGQIDILTRSQWWMRDGSAGVPI